jgi:hypothetical protein
VALYRQAAVAVALVVAAVTAGVATWPRHGEPAASAASMYRQPSTADLDLLSQAEETLIQRCMAQRGFRYHKVPFVSDSDEERFPFVVDDVAWAGSHGYGSAAPAAEPDDEYNGPNSPDFAGLSASGREAYSAALYGSEGGPHVVVTLPDGGGRLAHSTGGCQADAERQLYGSFGRWFRDVAVVANLAGLAAGRATADPRYQHALSAWDRCMGAAGHAVDSPQQWRLQLRSEMTDLHGAAAQAAERRYATTEARCAVSTRFGPVSRDVYRSYLEPLRHNQARVVREQRDLQYAALERARHTVDEKQS